MPAPKKVFSIYLDVKRELKTVFASVSGGKIRVEGFDHAMMVTSLKQEVEEFADLPEGEPGIEAAEQVFGIADEAVEISDETLFEEGEDTGEVEVVDDIEEIEDQGELTNEDVLLSLVQRVDAKKFNYAINIPASLLSVFHLRENYKDLKPKVQKSEIRSVVRERLAKDIPNDHIAYIMDDKEGAISFSYEGNIPLLTAIDGITPHLDAKPKYSLAVPDEISLQNIIRLNEEPGEDDYIAIIDMEETTTRIIISKGGDIVHIPPPVQGGTETPEVMNTIYSKILYEQDMGNMPDFQKIILTGEARDVNAREFLNEKFGEVDVEYLTIKTDKIELPDELVEDLPEYAVPLGMALTALLPKNERILPVNMLPDYVVARQRTLKIEWHGMIVLLLIFTTPFYINWQNQKKSALKLERTQRINHLNTSIIDLEWAEPLVDSLAIRMTLADENMALIDSLAKGTLRFSVTLNKINKAILKVNNLWLTDFTSRGEAINISGFSLYRNRIHRLADEFVGANIQSVTPARIRNKPVYRFQMILDKIVDDEALFDPVVIIPELEPEPEPEPEIPVVEEVLIVEEPVVVVPEETLAVEIAPEDTMVMPLYEAMDLPPGAILPDTLYGQLFTVETPPDYYEEMDSLFSEEQLYDTVIVSQEDTLPEETSLSADTSNLFDFDRMIYVDKQNLPLLYSEAYGHYINSEYYAAMEIFIAIADARLSDSLTDNAQYWVGECLLALDMPDQAIIALERLFELYPESNKIEPGQLLLGKAYAEVGRLTDALQVLNLLLETNPEGEFAPKARYLLKTLSKQG